MYSVAAGRPLTLAVVGDDGRLELRLRPERPPEGLGLRLLERGVGIAVRAARGGLEVERVVPASEAAERGLRPDGRVLAANGQRLRDAESLGREVLRGLDRGGLLLVVGRGRYAYNLNFPL